MTAARSESLANAVANRYSRHMIKQITPSDRARIAAACGVNERYLYQCLTGRRDMNPAEARRVEVESEGEITRQMLCQKTYEGIWPELAITVKAA